MLILLKYRINILYPPWHSGIAESHFVVSLLIRNNKMGHRINKMDIHFNKVGHRNSKVGHRNNKVGVYETTKWGSVPVSWEGQASCPPNPPLRWDFSLLSGGWEGQAQ